MQPGTSYVASGRFNPLKTIIATIIGITVALYVSSMYTTFTSIYPFVVWRVVFMTVIVCGLAIMIVKLNSYSHNRNRIVSGIFAGIICYTYWAASWSFIHTEGAYTLSFFTTLINPLAIIEIIPKHIISLSEDGGGVYFLVFNPFILSLAYLAEFMIFVFIVYLATKPSPYCEACKSFHQHKKLHIADAKGFKERLTQDSHYLRFLSEETFYKHQEQDPLIKNDQAIQMGLYTCTCNENALVEASCFAVRAIDKKPAKLVGEEKLIQRVYIEKTTADVLLKKSASLL